MVFEKLLITSLVQWKPECFVVRMCCSLASNDTKEVCLMKCCTSNKQSVCSFTFMNLSVHYWKIMFMQCLNDFSAHDSFQMLIVGLNCIFLRTSQLPNSTIIINLTAGRNNLSLKNYVPYAEFNCAHSITVRKFNSRKKETKSSKSTLECMCPADIKICLDVWAAHFVLFSSV